MPELYASDCEADAYAELSIRWIGICCLDQDLDGGLIAAHDQESCRRELANRRRVYEERLALFASRFGDDAAARLRRRVESEKVISTRRPNPVLPATAKRACRPQQSRAARRTAAAPGWVQQGLPLGF